jgi:hypothetical protein
MGSRWEGPLTPAQPAGKAACQRGPPATASVAPPLSFLLLQRCERGDRHPADQSRRHLARGCERSRAAADGGSVGPTARRCPASPSASDSAPAFDACSSLPLTTARPLSSGVGEQPAASGSAAAGRRLSSAAQANGPEFLEQQSRARSSYEQQGKLRRCSVQRRKLERSQACRGRRPPSALWPLNCIGDPSKCIARPRRPS